MKIASDWGAGHNCPLLGKSDLRKFSTSAMSSCFLSELAYFCLSLCTEILGLPFGLIVIRLKYSLILYMYLLNLAIVCGLWGRAWKKNELLYLDDEGILIHQLKRLRADASHWFRLWEVLILFPVLASLLLSFFFVACKLEEYYLFVLLFDVLFNCSAEASCILITGFMLLSEVIGNL